MRGWYGWLLVLAVVVAYDVTAALTGGEPMSSASRRWWASHGWPQWALIVVAVFVAVHLIGGWGPHDPLDRLDAWIRRRVKT